MIIGFKHELRNIKDGNFDDYERDWLKRKNPTSFSFEYNMILIFDKRYLIAMKSLIQRIYMYINEYGNN